MLTTIALVIGALMLVLLAYAATRPDAFHIARTANIKAPAEKIFPRINNLKELNTWIPFLKDDPNIQIVYTGPDAGKGAAHDWAGNKKVGKGHIEITESVPPSRITMKLDMLEPMQARNTVMFTLATKGATTDVTWAMDGKCTFASKLMGLFMSPDKMVGGAFEKGLADLKVLAEK